MKQAEINKKDSVMLNEHFVDLLVSEIEEHFSAPRDDLYRFVEYNAKTFIEFSEYYDNNTKRLVTQDRDVLFDVIGKHFCKRPWPSYGEDVNVKKQFYDTLRHHTNDVGWKFLE